MTPLAHKIAKELTLRKRDRTFIDNADILSRFDEVHCFECSAVYGAARELAADIFRRPCSADRLAFLPAAPERTWIEISPQLGFLLEDKGDGWARVTIATDKASLPFGEMALSDRLSSASADDPIVRVSDRSPLSQSETIAMMYQLYALLAMINTPRLIGRTTHMPHAGLQRALAKARGLTGKFPLRAWTEIKLQVRPPIEEEGDEAIYLTGARALHFVRAHLRIRLGRLELVSAHWRGDASLGIKRSRYRLAA